MDLDRQELAGQEYVKNIEPYKIEGEGKQQGKVYEGWLLVLPWGADEKAAFKIEEKTVNDLHLENESERKKYIGKECEIKFFLRITNFGRKLIVREINLV